MTTETTWVFDETPPSGSRRGGNPSEHAFEQDFDTFVREALQNSNDVAVDAPVEVSFNFNVFEGDDLDDLKDCIDWPSLRDHLVAAKDTEGGKSIGNELEKLASNNKLRVLAVEDTNTEGLTGEEAGGKSNFTALCKDTLYSHKEGDSSAGGTYGLGKSVHWSFSQLATVLFNSILQEDPDNQSPRLIGRSELPSHEIGGQWYTGSGWFGSKNRIENKGMRAESIWSERAEALAKKLGIGRETNGTSILILGFRDPTTSEKHSMQEAAKRILSAAGKYFWPALLGNRPRLAVKVNAPNFDRELDIQEQEEIEYFVDCYKAYLSGDIEKELNEPGDIAKRDIDVVIPEKRDGNESVKAKATLVVRLAGEETGGLAWSVAPFRKPGMVIDYWNRKNVALDGLPFHATLICGEARNPGNPSKGDEALEEFLRLAEPPAHNDWQSTEKLRETYTPGYKKAIDELKLSIRNKLQELTTPKTTGDERGPDRLRRKFPISNSGKGGLLNGGERGESAFHFQDLNARFHANIWEFEGKIEPHTTNHGGWKCEVSLYQLGEDGNRVEGIKISSIDIGTLGVDSVNDKGDSTTIVAGEGVSSVRFYGESERIPNPEEVGEMEIGLKGELLEEEE